MSLHHLIRLRGKSRTGNTESAGSGQPCSLSAPARSALEETAHLKYIYWIWNVPISYSRAKKPSSEKSQNHKIRAIEYTRSSALVSAKGMRPKLPHQLRSSAMSVEKSLCAAGHQCGNVHNPQAMSDEHLEEERSSGFSPEMCAETWVKVTEPLEKGHPP